MMDVGPFGGYKKKLQKYVRNERNKIPEDVQNRARAIRCCVIKAALKAYVECTDPSTIRSGFKSAGIRIVNEKLMIDPAAVLGSNFSSSSA